MHGRFDPWDTKMVSEGALALETETARRSEKKAEYVDEPQWVDTRGNDAKSDP